MPVMNQWGNYSQLHCSYDTTRIRGTKKSRTSQGCRNITFISSGTKEERGSQLGIASGNIHLAAYTGWIYRILRTFHSLSNRENKNRISPWDTELCNTPKQKEHFLILRSGVLLLYIVIFDSPSHIVLPI